MKPVFMIIFLNYPIELVFVSLDVVQAAEHYQCLLLNVPIPHYLQNNRMQDTTAARARKGKDIQGIPWERLSVSREKYRQTRLEQYKNYENIPQSGEGSEKVNRYIFCTSCFLTVF